MSKEAREAQFLAEMAKEAQPDAEIQFAHSIHKIERETGILIDENFLLLKFFNLLDNCELCMQEKEDMDAEDKANTTIGGYNY